MNSLGNKKLDELQKQFLKLSKQSMGQLEKQKNSNPLSKQPKQPNKTKITSYKSKQSTKLVKEKPKKEIIEQQNKIEISNDKEVVKIENIVDNSPIISPIGSPLPLSKDNYFPNPYGLNSVTARSYNSHFELPSSQYFPRDSSQSKYCPLSPNTSTTKEYAETLNLSERQFKPKFFHKHMINKINYKSVLSNYSKDLQSPQRESILRSSRKDFVTENKQLTRNINSARSYNQSGLSSDLSSLYTSLETSATVLHFYTDILRTLETLRFTIVNQTVELEFGQNVSTKNDQILSRKLGTECYSLVKKLYLNARKERVGQEGIRDRQIINLFGKQLQFFGKIIKFNQHTLEVIIQKQMLKRKVILFQDFVEILYSVSKLAYKNEQLSNEERFQRFIEKEVKNQLNLIEYIDKQEFSEQIQVFFEPFNPFENPAGQYYQFLKAFIVALFYENHNFLKHIFSLYENTNFKIDKEENFISLKEFIKLCKDYLVVPNFCCIQSATKIFRALQKGNNEIISFTGLIITLCCIAHLSQQSFQQFIKEFATSQQQNESAGFFQRISKLLETMKNANNGIAEELMQQAFAKHRE